MTGYSENNTFQIGNNMDSKISKYLNQIGKIKICKIHKKKKAENKRYAKIKNIVNDLHWKTIKYLTDNYGHILIGNMSTKQIGETNLNKHSKNIAKMMSLYVFRERLKYKCSITDTKYKLVDEHYTSKMCTNCGYVKENLGSNKIFKCEHCGIKLNRDINGARNMFIKSILP